MSDRASQKDGNLCFFSEKINDIDQERAQIPLRTIETRRIRNEALRELFSPLPTTRLHGTLSVTSGLKTAVGTLSVATALAGERETIQTIVEFVDPMGYEAARKRLVDESRQRSAVAGSRPISSSAPTAMPPPNGTPTPVRTSTPTPTRTTTPAPTTTATRTPTPYPPSLREGPVINELCANPMTTDNIPDGVIDGDAAVELFNSSTSALDLSDYRLCVNDTCLWLEGTVEPFGYKVYYEKWDGLHFNEGGQNVVRWSSWGNRRLAWSTA